MSKAIRLRKLGSELKKVVESLQKEGIAVDYTHLIEGRALVSIVFYPFTICSKCDFWSAASECPACREELGDAQVGRIT